ncbi:MAG: hypothetical protein ACLUBL_02020 [Fusobacterium sp.]|uniref:hypothetical protein n=1 Tax=Fusobacterium sp. TaxID=68766 RepID=UPI0039949B1A
METLKNGFITGIILALIICGLMVWDKSSFITEMINGIFEIMDGCLTIIFFILAIIFIFFWLL